MDSPEDKSWSLHQLLLNVDNAIQTTLPATYWVRAEILHVQARGWWSLELSSYDDGKKAKARAMIWQSQSSIVQKFEKATGTPLAKGLKIMARVKVGFHAEYGLSLTIQELDPAFSLGDMEARLNQIRERLVNLYEYSLNRELDIPLEFTRVAVIAPSEAAGLGDFKSQAKLLEHNGICSFIYFSALFQGEKSEESLINAMKSIVDQHRDEHFDAVAIIRGGGDKAGLYELNQFRIARGICRLPLPVMVGVGHERDSTILDEVANQAFATPSLVIARIMSTVIDNARQASKDHSTISHSSRHLLDAARSTCVAIRENIHHLAGRNIATARAEVMNSHQRVTLAPRRILNVARQKLGLLYSSLNHGSILCLQRQREWVGQTHQALMHASSQSIKHAYSILQTEKARIDSAAMNQILSARGSLAHLQANIISDAEKLNERARLMIDRYHSIVSNLNPERILERGFSLVLNADGRPVTKRSEVSPNDDVQLKFHDGVAKATIK